MATNGPSNQIDILLIGKTGNGKSATGNSILGRKCFKSVSSATSVTKQIHSEYAQVEDRVIKVVDGPGVGDTDLNEENALDLVIDSVQQAIAASPAGYHAFILVVRFGGRFTKEDIQTVKLLKGIFGEEFVRKFCILLVTCGDNYDPEETNSTCFKDWCYKQAGVFRELVDECNGRVILFDNRTKDEAKLRAQRIELIKEVDAVSELGLRYTDDNFKRAQRERDRLTVESNEPRIKEETLREASILIQNLSKIQLDDPETQIGLLETLKQKALGLQQSVKEQDKETGVLQELIKNARHIFISVENQITSAQNAKTIQKKKEENLRKMEEMRAQMEEARRQDREQDLRDMKEDFERKREEDEAYTKQLQDMVGAMKKENTEVQEEYSEAADNSMQDIISVVGSVLGVALRFVAKAVMRRVKRY